MRRSRLILLVPSVIVAGGVGLVLLPKTLTPAGSGCLAAVGYCSPPFTLRDTSNRAVTLSRFHGEPVLLNFWAVNCPACWKEEPSLHRAARVFQPRGLIMLGIDAWAEPAQFVRGYIRYAHFNYRVLIDPTQSVPDRYGMWKTPQSVFIDRSGRITFIHLGPLNWEEIVRQASRILQTRGGNSP